MVLCINLFKNALMPELSKEIVTSTKCTFHHFLFSKAYVVPLVKKRPVHGEFYGALQKIIAKSFSVYCKEKSVLKFSVRLITFFSARHVAACLFKKRN